MKTIQQIAAEIGELVIKKNAAYGNSVKTSTEVLKIYFPNGIPVKKYDDALLIARISDKLSRIAHEKEAFQESPYQDIAGYGILGVRKDSIGNDAD